MRIAMIGTGYVGLVSGACFSEFGAEVACVDKDKSKIERLLAGDIPIYEPGLDTLVEKNVAAERLSFTTDLEAAVKGADAVFIAVAPAAAGGSSAAPRLGDRTVDHRPQPHELPVVALARRLQPEHDGRRVD